MIYCQVTQGSPHQSIGARGIWNLGNKMIPEKLCIWWSHQTDRNQERDRHGCWQGHKNKFLHYIWTGTKLGLIVSHSSGPISISIRCQESFTAAKLTWAHIIGLVPKYGIDIETHLVVFLRKMVPWAGVRELRHVFPCPLGTIKFS